MHAAGVVISEGAIWDHVPVFCPEKDVYVTQFHKDDVEAAGLVKFDFLGLRTLTVVDIASKLIDRRPDRQVFVVQGGIRFLLPAVRVNLLPEVSLPIKQPDRDKRNSKIRGAFQMVTGQDTKTARVDRHGFVQPEFRGKICSQPLPENGRVRGAPGISRCHIFDPAPIRPVDARMQHLVSCTLFKPFRRILLEEHRRIVSQFGPSYGVDRSIDCRDFRLPAPPEIAGHFDQLFMDRLRGMVFGHGIISILHSQN